MQSKTTASAVVFADIVTRQFFYPARKETKSRATMLMILMTGLIAGPAVSL
jgi:hypothetical protein